MNSEAQIDAFIADAGYGSIQNFEFIVKELKAKAIIPENPRNKKPETSNFLTVVTLVVLQASKWS